MTIKDYYDYIEKGKEIINKIQYYTQGENFKSTNGYTLNGFILQDIDDFVELSIDIVNSIGVE